MDPVTFKMAAQIVGTLLQSKTLRNVVVAFLMAWAMLASFVAVTPVLVAQSVLGVRLSQQITLQSGSCMTGWDGTGHLPAMEGLSPNQVRLAFVMWQMAHRQTMGDQGAVVGLVVLAQESTWGSNPRITRPNGDGDAGPLQQRTLPGWYGTLRQVNDPEYAFSVFFTGRTVTASDVARARAAGVRPAGPAGYHIPGLTNIAGWQAMPVTQAAQAVQRSAFPTAYGRHERTARHVVSRFRAGTVASGGRSAVVGGSECGPRTVVGMCRATGLAAERGLTPDALLLLRCGKQAWPKVVTWYGVGQRSGRSDHPRGGAIDIMIPRWRTPAGKQLGKRIADWAVTNRRRLGVKYVIWNASVWNAERSDGWRACATTSCYSGPNDTQAHRDHVHVSVYGTRTVRAK